MEEKRGEKAESSYIPFVHMNFNLYLHTCIHIFMHYDTTTHDDIERVVTAF